MTDKVEIARWREMSENGWSGMMYFLASALLTSDDAEDRGDEAAKWLYMSKFLGYERSMHALEFVNASIGIERFDKACEEATEWLGRKFEDFETDKDISKWSTELYECVKKGDDVEKRRSSIKLVWNNESNKK